MIDAVHSFHSPIFDAPKSKKLPPSFYWGILFAVLLHLALLYYFFNQTFTTAFVDNPPEPRPSTVEIIDLPKPPPPTPQSPPVSHVVVHPPASQPPAKVETLPVNPAQATNTITERSLTPPILSPAAGGASSSAAPADPYVKARWTRFPDSDALAQYYPDRAANDEVEGTATVECTVLDKAGHVRCTALSEIPGNYGFGKATVRMVQAKGRVDTSQGDVKIGSVLRTTVKWQLN
jgi:protein TonB